MKIELECTDEIIEELVIRQLRMWYELCDPDKVRLQKDKDDCATIREHLLAVIAYASPPNCMELEEK